MFSFHFAGHVTIPLDKEFFLTKIKRDRLSPGHFFVVKLLRDPRSISGNIQAEYCQSYGIAKLKLYIINCEMLIAWMAGLVSRHVILQSCAEYSIPAKINLSTQHSLQYSTFNFSSQHSVVAFNMKYQRVKPKSKLVISIWHPRYRNDIVFFF